MNTQVLDFFRTYYAPGRVCLIGSSNPIYMLIREAQKRITNDGKPSKYNHTLDYSIRKLTNARDSYEKSVGSISGFLFGSIHISFSNLIASK